MVVGFALLTATLAVSPTAEAKEFELFGRTWDFRATTTLRYDWRADNGNGPNVLEIVDPATGTVIRRPFNDFDDEYHYVFHTMDLQLGTGGFRMGARLDLNLFLDHPLGGCAAGGDRPAACANRYLNQFYMAREDREIPGGDEPLKFVSPERFFLSYTADDWDVIVGDFTVSFGAGIALMAIKVSEIGQDNAIRGGKLRIHKGPVDVTMLAGTFNFLDMDAFTGVAARTIWPEEQIFGGSFEYTFGDGALKLGTHLVHTLRNAKGSQPTDTIWGLRAGLPNLLDGDLNISAEIDVQRSFNGTCVSRGPTRDCDERLENNLHGFRGMASYLRASLSKGNWTFTFESKYFNDFQLQGPQSGVEAYRLTYAQPPTLERVYAVPTETFSTGGARVRVDYNFEEIFGGRFELLVFANYTWMRSWGEEGLLELHDPYGGWELAWMEGRGHWNLMGGLRLERNHERGETFRTDIHLFGDVEQLLVARHALSLIYFYRHATKQLMTKVTFTQMDLSLGYKWSPRIALAAYIGYSSEPVAVGDDPRFFFGGEARYFFNPSTYARVYVGERRGGLICVNGICRVVPQFAGVIVEGVARF